MSVYHQMSVCHHKCQQSPPSRSMHPFPSLQRSPALTQHVHGGRSACWSTGAMYGPREGTGGHRGGEAVDGTRPSTGKGEGVCGRGRGEEEAERAGEGTREKRRDSPGLSILGADAGRGPMGSRGVSGVPLHTWPRRRSAHVDGGEGDSERSSKRRSSSKGGLTPHLQGPMRCEGGVPRVVREWSHEV